MTNIIENDVLLQQKRDFALLLLRAPTEPFKAACAVAGADTGRALEISTTWPNDPEVRGFMDDLVAASGDEAFLPSKADLSRTVWEIAHDASRGSDIQLKALRLYADIRGFIERQGATINNNILTSNKVMLVKDSGTAEEWERNLLDQQKRLIVDADAAMVS